MVTGMNKKRAYPMCLKALVFPAFGCIFCITYLFVPGDSEDRKKLQRWRRGREMDV